MEPTVASPPRPTTAPVAAPASTPVMDVVAPAKQAVNEAVLATPPPQEQEDANFATDAATAASSPNSEEEQPIKSRPLPVSAAPSQPKTQTLGINMAIMATVLIIIALAGLAALAYIKQR